MSKKVNVSNIKDDTGPNNNLIKTKSDLSKREFFLKGKNIGVSISESDELNQLGYDVAHLNDLIIETARYMLSLGGKLAYGGDMRNGGFTEMFFDLLNYYKVDTSLHANERFHSYLAWPISLGLNKSQEAELSHSVSFHKIPPPQEIITEVNAKEFLVPNTSSDFYIWSRCLTEMREAMSSQCDARIFVGGKTQSFKGKCPGVLEELMLTIKKGQPLYLIGAFGGITADAIAALNGEQSERLKKEYYIQDETYASFFEFHNEKSIDEIDFDIYFNMLKDLNWKGLSELNGLSIGENKRLASTPHLNEMIFLILKGLKSKFID
ncbi:MAG: hypothetical protein JJU02_00885 [Cryomorphaceae bacterium]|nr:hypothetical protein [Cryomorphaceae bacterium]